MSEQIPRALNKIATEVKNLATLTRKLTKRTNKTKMVEVDLTSPHLDEALGLETLGVTFYWLTIERCDDSLNYKLKQTDGTESDIFRAFESARISQHDFVDIIVSNPAGTGVCRFVLGYWSD